MQDGIPSQTVGRGSHQVRVEIPPTPASPQRVTYALTAVAISVKEFPLL